MWKPQPADWLTCTFLSQPLRRCSLCCCMSPFYSAVITVIHQQWCRVTRPPPTTFKQRYFYIFAVWYQNMQIFQHAILLETCPKVRVRSGCQEDIHYITVETHSDPYGCFFFFFGLFFKNLSLLSESVRSVTGYCGTEKWDDEFWDVKKMELKYWNSSGLTSS